MPRRRFERYLQAANRHRAKRNLEFAAALLLISGDAKYRKDYFLELSHALGTTSTSLTRPAISSRQSERSKPEQVSKREANMWWGRIKRAKGIRREQQRRRAEQAQKEADILTRREEGRKRAEHGNQD